MPSLREFCQAHQLGVTVLPNVDGFQAKACDLNREGEVWVIEFGRRIVPVGQGVTQEEAKEALAGRLDLKLLEIRDQGRVLRMIPPQSVEFDLDGCQPAV